MHKCIQSFAQNKLVFHYISLQRQSPSQCHTNHTDSFNYPSHHLLRQWISIDIFAIQKKMWSHKMCTQMEERNEYSTFASSMNAKHRFCEYTENHCIVVSKWARLTTKRIMQLMFWVINHLFNQKNYFPMKFSILLEMILECSSISQRIVNIMTVLSVCNAVNSKYLWILLIFQFELDL